MGIIYPLFFLGSFITAAIIYLHRKTYLTQAIAPNGTALTWEKNPGIRKITGIGLFLKPDTTADVARIQNLTNEIDAIQSGQFIIQGSTLGKI